MAGVFSPTIRRQTRHGVQVLISFALGMVLAVLVLGLVPILARRLLDPIITLQARLRIFYLLVLALCVLDLAKRTPTLRRQTPGSLWMTKDRRFASLIWGLDIGLHGTTIRMTSLTWLLLSWGILLAPPALFFVLVAEYAIALYLGILIATLALASDRWWWADIVDIRHSFRTILTIGRAGTLACFFVVLLAGMFNEQQLWS